MIEVDEGNTAVIACDLPESHPKAQVRYSVKHEWLEASRGEHHKALCHCIPMASAVLFLADLSAGSLRVSDKAPCVLTAWD